MLRNLRYASITRCEDLLADAQLLAEVAHRDPQAQDLGAALLDHCPAAGSTLPSDFDILRPSTSIRKPWVSTSRNGGAPARAQADEQRALEPAAMLVAAFEIHVGRPRQVVAERAAPPRGSTPSRTTRRGCRARARSRVPPHDGQARPGGMNSSIGRSYHASAPYSSNTDAARSTSAPVITASPHEVQSTAGIGTPQARWREMHQSGRFDSMLNRRSRPHAGIHFTSRSMAVEAGLPQRLALAPCRSPITGSPSRRMNHCDVARKITGLWQRQQCGYWCAKSARCHRRAALLQRLLDVRVRVEHALPGEHVHRVEERVRPGRPARRCRARSGHPC